MIRLSSNIVIGAYAWLGHMNVEVVSSWETLTDTCTITVPRRISWEGKELASGDNALVKREDQVLVELGYDDDNVETFRGYVRTINVDSPTTITCEDAAYLLKRGKFTKTYRDATLSDVLQDALGSILPYEAPAIRLGPFRISKATPAEVLQYLKEKYLIKSWIRDGKLYAGLAVWPDLQNTIKVNFSQNVVEHSLDYQRAEDVKIKLTLINMTKGNEKQEYEFGDPDGEQRTLHYYDLNEADINAIGEEQIKRLRYSGYKGDITIYGKPLARHGDVADITDPVYPERSGRYLIKTVTTSHGVGGYRQVLELAEQV